MTLAGPQPRSPAAVDALAELRRAPRRVALRAIERLEAGITTLDPKSDVPAGWFLSTASGYALEAKGKVHGALAIANAGAIVEALCVEIVHRPDELPEGSLGVRELASRWNVASRTLQRYRAQGLCARRVREGRSWRLAFAPAVVSAFEAGHLETLERAKGFARLTDAERARALERAGELAGKSPSAAAAVIAAEIGRSHEAVRQWLVRSTGADDGWTLRQRQLALRAHDRFLEPATIAQRVGHDATATRRMIDAGRLERLRSLDLLVTSMDEPPKPGTALGAPGPTLLADLVAEMRHASPPERAFERQVTMYARFLVARAAHAFAHTSAGRLRAEPIDAAETDLLWAARLRVEALRPLLGIVLRGVEARLGDDIESLPARRAIARLELALAAAAQAAHRYDPTRGGRLSAAVTVAVDRAAGESGPSAPRAGARRAFAQASIADWTRHVAPWQAFLEPPAALRRGLPSIDPTQRALLEARYGLGERPHTLAQLAERFGIHRPWTARRVREAARAAIAAGRRIDTISP